MGVWVQTWDLSPGNVFPELVIFPTRLGYSISVPCERLYLWLRWRQMTALNE